MSTIAKLVESGPNKGFYTLSTLADRIDTTGSITFQNFRRYQDSLQTDSNLYHRYSPGPGIMITGFNRTLLPYIDGYYYVRKDADLPRLLYALENRLVPSDGNTELFNIQFTNIHVPDDWCPFLLEPCLDGWCSKCMNKQVLSVNTRSSGCAGESILTITRRWLWLTFLCMMFSALILFIAKMIIYVPFDPRKCGPTKLRKK